MCTCIHMYIESLYIYFYLHDIIQYFNIHIYIYIMCTCNTYLIFVQYIETNLLINNQFSTTLVCSIVITFRCLGSLNIGIINK